MKRIQFPAGFLWGAAAAAYQVEGSPLADGAGPTNWHEFTHRRGKVRDGTNGDVACDHYHRVGEDIRHMADLGLGAYRFSIGWGRIFPEPGKVNEKGLDFYDRLIDGLLATGIEPWITIFHLEEPAWLSRMGGFAVRSAVDHLVEFGLALFRRYGDRVRSWITINEPSVYALLGRITGNFPPGRRLDLRGTMHCVHHLLLAHARLCRAWTESLGKGMIGLAHHAAWIDPANPESARDREAAAFIDDAANRSILDPVLRGTFPERVRNRLGRFLSRDLDKDLAEMRAPGTYVGLNYYARSRYRWSFLLPFFHAWEYRAPDAARSAMWEIHPPGLLAMLLRLKEEYGNPACVITENGFPLPEAPGRDPLDDPERIAYLSDHIAMVGRAIAQGVDCRGYFHWSLMDNFEWNLGLSMRFGLLRTDFSTLERKWKKSAYWYRDLVRRNALEL